ncbi:hypothetical protein [Pseudomonas phage IR-QUMS-PaBa1-GHS-2021]|uniref:hypothetical protein n=1 Tax=Pseudomonas aeruginosa TaxID=287 RepID=UPI001BD50D2B|nr:hypothetical protein [Pseudomonas aeruginosa]MBS9730307.1 hypothetical protein [Pseudomonas aeruginosa]UZV40051.1 hypothetical protein [Pseudomonas phage IR-QUMS-PaBa1-GHS-2021]
MFYSQLEVVEAVQRFSEAHNTPLDKIAIGGGGAIMLMGGRETTYDLNIWVDSPFFERIAETQNALLSPMRDNVFRIETTIDSMDQTDHVTTRRHYWVRKRNLYFPTVPVKLDQCPEVYIFDTMSLLIQKRGSYSQPERGLRRKQDYSDICFLNALLKEEHKVRA